MDECTYYATRVSSSVRLQNGNPKTFQYEEEEEEWHLLYMKDSIQHIQRQRMTQNWVQDFVGVGFPRYKMNEWIATAETGPSLNYLAGQNNGVHSLIRSNIVICDSFVDNDDGDDDDDAVDDDDDDDDEDDDNDDDERI